MAACSWASVVSGYSLPLPGSLVQVPVPNSTSAAPELMQDAQHAQRTAALLFLRLLKNDLKTERVQRGCLSFSKEQLAVRPERRCWT